MAKYGQEKGSTLTGFTRKAMNLLLHYSWPGNVRELENLVERLLVLCEGEEADVEDLPDKIASGAVQASAAVPLLELPETGIDLSTAVNEFEKSNIVQALTRSNWVKNRAAKLLHVNRTTLVEKIKKQKLQKPAEINLD
jgi:DNA-binding NtrC family response regulator